VLRAGLPPGCLGCSCSVGSWEPQKGRGLGWRWGLGLQGVPCAVCRYIDSYTNCVVAQAFQRAAKRRR
jgi:hypothetical protein